MQGSRWTLAAVLKLKFVVTLLPHWTKYSWTSVFHWTSRVPSPVWLRIETWCTAGAWLITCIASVQYVCRLGIFMQRFFTLHLWGLIHKTSLIWLQQTICRTWMTDFWPFAWQKSHLIFCIFAGTSSTDHVLCAFVQLPSPFNLGDLLFCVCFCWSSSSFPFLENTFVQAG